MLTISKNIIKWHNLFRRNKASNSQEQLLQHFIKMGFFATLSQKLLFSPLVCTVLYFGAHPSRFVLHVPFHSTFGSMIQESAMMTFPHRQFHSSLHCCSIESIPHSEEKYFVCGMYELIEESQHRRGRVALCDENGMFYEMDVSSGILDMKFNCSTVACALSSGEIALYSYDNRELCPLQHLTGSDEGLALSIGWSGSAAPGNTSRASHFAISSENGSIQTYSFDSQAGYCLSRNISRAHVLFDECVPVWITAFNVHDDNVLVSGGDDLAVRLWDIRSSSSVYQSKNHFTAGVTSAQWHPLQTHILAVGSYDGSIKIWDDRTMRVPLSDIHTDLGGVWRLKWNCLTGGAGDSSGTGYRHSDESYLAAACMHGGSRIYRVDCTCDDIARDPRGHIVSTHQDSNNPDRLVYGIDWLQLAGRSDEGEEEYSIKWEVVTCSFYDNNVQIWKN